MPSTTLGLASASTQRRNDMPGFNYPPDKRRDEDEEPVANKCPNPNCNKKHFTADTVCDGWRPGYKTWQEGDEPIKGTP